MLKKLNRWWTPVYHILVPFWTVFVVVFCMALFHYSIKEKGKINKYESSQFGRLRVIVKSIDERRMDVPGFVFITVLEGIYMQLLSSQIPFFFLRVHGVSKVMAVFTLTFKTIQKIHVQFLRYVFLSCVYIPVCKIYFFSEQSYFTDDAIQQRRRILSK